MPKYANIQHCPQNSRQVFSNGIGQGITNFLETYNARKEKEVEEKNDENLLAQMENPDLTPLAKAALASRLSKKGQKALGNILTFEERFKRDEELAARHGEESDIRRAREKRLTAQGEIRDLQRAYQNRLGNIREDLKDVFLPQDQKKALQQERDALQKELGHNLSRLKQGKVPQFNVLQVEEPESMPVRRAPVSSTNELGGGRPNMLPGNTAAPNVNQLQNAMQATQPQQMQRQKWNPQDPAHVAFAKSALEASGGDRTIANNLISERFEK